MRWFAAELGTSLTPRSYVIIMVRLKKIITSTKTPDRKIVLIMLDDVRIVYLFPLTKHTASFGLIDKS